MCEYCEYIHELLDLGYTQKYEPIVSAIMYEDFCWSKAVKIPLIHCPNCGMKLQESEGKESEDCVSRQAVETLVDELARAISDERCSILRGRSTATIMRDIRHLPSVTSTEKTGKWIIDGAVDCYLETVKCHCSECGEKQIFPAHYDHINDKLFINYDGPQLIDKFCSVCGAKMGVSE